jgi:hypothetical protein
MPELTLKEQCQHRLEGLKKMRAGYEAEAKDIASLAQPARSRWLASDSNKNTRQRNRSLNNSHGIWAFRTLQGGMTSGLSSPSRPWMTLGSFDERMSEDAEVRTYFAEVERLVYAFLASTNFYGAVKTGYLEMGLFGTEACIMLEHPQEGAVCHQLTFGEYWLGMGTAMSPNALYRVCPMTVKNAVETFGTDNLHPRFKDMYARAQYDEIIELHHAIEENPDFVEGRLGPEGKPWRSLYWDAADSAKDRVIVRNGFDEQPFWAPRWDTTGADVWGQGPGHDALPDLRELQLQAKRKAEATDHHLFPEMITDSKLKLKRQPKSMSSIAATDVTRMVHVPYQVPYQTIGVIREDIDGIKDAINQSTYADLFMAITNMNGIQPRNVEEIAARNEEKLTQLGPVIERVNNEKLEIAIERVIGIMQRANILPPAPEALRDAPDIKIEFVSILTQMQRMVGLGQIERAVGFVGSQAAVFPNMVRKIDEFELLDEYWSRAGAPSKLLRPTEDVMEDLEADAQQQQMAQAAEMAKTAAPAAGVAVDAARLMAETPQMAPPSVEDLVPLLPR